MGNNVISFGLFVKSLLGLGHTYAYAKYSYIFEIFTEATSFFLFVLHGLDKELDSIFIF